MTRLGGREVAVLRVRGARVVRMGGRTSVDTAGATRLIAHTHPKSGRLDLSGGGKLLGRRRGDVERLRRLRQRSTVIIDPGSRTAVRLRVPYTLEHAVEDAVGGTRILGKYSF